MFILFLFIITSCAWVSTITTRAAAFFITFIFSIRSFWSAGTATSSRRITFTERSGTILTIRIWTCVRIRRTFQIFINISIFIIRRARGTRRAWGTWLSTAIATWRTTWPFLVWPISIRASAWRTWIFIRAWRRGRAWSFFNVINFFNMSIVVRWYWIIAFIGICIIT